MNTVIRDEDIRTGLTQRMKTPRNGKNKMALTRNGRMGKLVRDVECRGL